MVRIPLTTSAKAPLEGCTLIFIELTSNTPGAVIKGTRSKVILPSMAVARGTAFIVGGIVLQPTVKIVAVTGARELSQLPLFMLT